MDATTLNTRFAYLTTLRASLVAFTVLAPACVLDTKISANPEDETSTTDMTTSIAEETTDLTTGANPTGGISSTGFAEDTGNVSSPTDPTDTGDDTDTDDTAGDACAPPYDSYESVIAVENDGTWSEAIDEACTVVGGQILPESFTLLLDCPEHSVLHGELKIGIVGGPMPAVPEVGEILDMYYQPWVDDFINTPRPEMLFLHSGGELMYSAAYGFFLDPNDAAVAAAHYAPLTVEVEPGPCPLVDNPDAEPGDGFICARQALAEVHLGGGEGEPLVLTMGMSAEITAGAATYATLVQNATWGEACVEANLEKFAIAIARKP